MIDWDGMAQRIHDNAAAKGFWDDERDFGEMIALMHSELSEALEEHRGGRPAVWVWHATNQAPMELTVGEMWGLGKDEKPEGVAVELADCIIRALDTLHHLAPIGEVGKHIETPQLGDVPERPENFGAALAFGHELLSAAHDAHTNPADVAGADARMLGAAIQWCEAMIGDLGVDVDAVIEAKMAYNATRPHKHGKRY